MTIIKKIYRAIMDFHPPFPLPLGTGWIWGWSIRRWLSGHEPETTRFFERNVKKTDRVADVGAAKGYYTLLFSKLAGSTIAFEPLPENFRLLKKAARSKAELHNVAISDKKGETNIHFAADKPSMASLMYAPGNQVHIVRIAPLRDFGKFDMVKIDVEGAELQVLRGMHKTRCVAEFSPKILRKMGTDPNEWLNEIRNLGYSLHAILPNGDSHPTDNATLIAIAGNGHINMYTEPI